MKKTSILCDDDEMRDDVENDEVDSPKIKSKIKTSLVNFCQETSFKDYLLD